MFRACIIAFLLTGIICFSVEGQNVDRKSRNARITGDTVQVDKSQQQPGRKFYDPKKASRKSALLPGLGQIYNDSWWKVPILYSGFGLTVYYIGFNNRQFKFYKNIAEDLIELQNTVGLSATETNQLRVARRQADSWRQNRDLLYITMVGIYALNIIEASIDAHLKGFNVDDNLALNIKPKIGVISNGVPYVGMGMTFTIAR